MEREPDQPDDELFPEIYDELRRVAGRYLQRERAQHTLQPTALVHEAWLRLQNDRRAVIHGRTHGLALGAIAMRRLLIDHGRHQKRGKRGGGVRPVAFDTLFDAAATASVPIEDLLAVEAALSGLEASDPRAAKVVSLRFYAGMTTAEIAEHLGVSTRTVEGEWAYARAWLKRELANSPDPPST